MTNETLFTAIIKAASSQPNARKLRRIERALARELLPVFEKQKKRILAKAKKLFNEKSTTSDKINIVLEVVDDTNDDLVSPILTQAGRAMLFGASYRISSLNLGVLGIAFDIEHPLAERYLKKDRRVLLESVLPQTTKDEIKPILLNALKTGQSYDVTSELIANAHSLSLDRAQMIAVNEIGNAYEEGNLIVMREVQNEGYAVQKFWSTVGDDRVTPSHTDNEGDGWIGIDETFSGTGDLRAPASDNPRCRCTLLWRFS